MYKIMYIRFGQSYVISLIALFLKGILRYITLVYYITNIVIFSKYGVLHFILVLYFQFSVTVCHV